MGEVLTVPMPVWLLVQTCYLADQTRGALSGPPERLESKMQMEETLHGEMEVCRAAEGCYLDWHYLRL